MTVHPIDPQRPRGGWLVTVVRSAGSTTRYARTREEMEEMMMRAKAAGFAVEVKAVTAGG